MGQSSLSPYSHIGIGDLARQSHSQSYGMGGIAAGLRSSQYINYMNPASYTVQDTNRFILDFGLLGSSTKWSTQDASSFSEDASLRSIAIGFPFTRWWKSSVGVMPYSSVNYAVFNVKEVILPGNELAQVNYQYEGRGGLNTVYWGNAFQLTPHFSVGVNARYFFGFIEKKIVMDPLDNTIFGLRDSLNIQVSDFALKFGVQYSNKLSDQWAYTLGATYQHQTRLAAKETYSSVVPGETNFRDTIAAHRDQKTDVELPASLRIGFSLDFQDKFQFGVDYQQSLWGDIQVEQQYVNSQILAVGMEYIPDVSAYSGYFNRVSYRLGARVGNSHLRIDEQTVDDYSLTLGLGFPFRFSNNSISIAYEAGRRGTGSPDMIQENYQFLWLNLTFHDVWFVKPKFK